MVFIPGKLSSSENPYPTSMFVNQMFFGQNVFGGWLTCAKKMNYPLYFPTTPMQDRESLVQRLVRAIKYNEITAYDPVDDEFTTRMSYEQVIKNLGAEDRVEKQIDESGNEVEVTIKGEIKWSGIKELLIKEDWFF